MSFFGEKDANVEEISRNNRIKKDITKQFAAVLKSLQKEYGGTGSSGPNASQQPIYSGDLPSHLCLCIEAVFLHGLKKAKFRKKWSGYFGGDGGSGTDGDPQSYSFWPFVIKFTHKDTVAQLKRSQHLKCDVGLCRAWVRTALNEGLIESYLSAMLADSGSTASYYRPVAYLRDAEQPTILMGLLRGLGELMFALSYNMPSLNIWTTGALAIAGLVESGSSPSILVPVGMPLPSPSPSTAGSVHDWMQWNHQEPAAAAASAGSPSTVGKRSSSGSIDSATSSNSSWLQPVSHLRQDDGDDLGTPAMYDPATVVSVTAAQEPSVAGHVGSEHSAGGDDRYCANEALRVAAIGNGRASGASGTNGSVGASAAVTPPVSVPEAFAASETASPMPSRNVLLSQSSADRDCGIGDDGDSLPPLIYSSSSGRRNPFLSSSWGLSQAATNGDKHLPETVVAGGGGTAPQQHGKGSTDGMDDKDTSSCYSYDNDGSEDGSGAVTALSWAVPRPPLEPMTGNSLGSLTGWASALSPADAADGLPSGSIDAGPGESGLRGARIVGSSSSRDHTPRGSPDYAASFAELMREYRPGWVSAPAHQALPSSALPQREQSQDASDGARESENAGRSKSGLLLAKSAEQPATAIASATLGRQSPDSDYEVLDPYDGQLAEDIGECYSKICSEKGLDSQNYQCKDCGRPVGIVYGVPRVCAYDGCYYCVECHVNDECLVPAKIIFNWDFKRYRVSKRCKAYLQSMENHPLLTVNQLNAKLYDHVPELQECRMLRVELCCLRKYLFQCAHQVAEELKRKVWPSEFLYDDPDTYSVAALALVMSGQLASVLRKAITFAKAHVYDCVICRQKGFFCELCGSSKVIFPFETESTVQCDKCHAVYHKACRRSASGCPKCARIRKRQAALGAQHEAAVMRTHASLY